MEKFSFVFCLIACTFGISMSEYIPVLMWQAPDSDKKSVETPSALSKLSSEQFSDYFLKKVAGSNHIVVFLEDNLSIEDFGGSSLEERYSYAHLRNITSSSSIHFLPSVQSPYKALKNSGFKLKTIRPKDFEGMLPDSEKTILVFKLGDATAEEDRPDFLKRHDATMADIYNNLVSKYDDLFALYTGHHSSWIEPYLKPNVRRVRQLLEDTTSGVGIFYNKSGIMLYSNNPAIFMKDGVETYINNTVISLTTSSKANLVTMSARAEDSTFKFTFSNDSGYWTFKSIDATVDGAQTLLLPTTEITAPIGFSYHCSLETVFVDTNSSGNTNLTFNGLQVEPFKTGSNSDSFNDAYDCVSFFSAPIWSGIFVTFLMALIMVWALTMIMDIKTMDQFDDPKGKTITISATD